ncbi:Cof-type HAD-IIB family hydrolase [Enterococcus sp. LJL99]
MIRLVALDLDGTLLDEKGDISESTLQTIFQLRTNGIKIVLCTGRPFYSLAPIIKKLKITGPKEYVVSFNGALLSDTQGTTKLFEKKLSFESLKEIKALSERLNISYHVQSHSGIFTSQSKIDLYTAYDAYLNQTSIHYIESSDFREIDSYKILFVGKKGALQTIISQIPNEFKQRYNTMQSLDYFYEFIHREASKGKALQVLAEYLGISPSEIMAIGDNENDLSMLKYAGVSVAMGNADDVIKRQTNHITKTNQEEGVRFSLLKLQQNCHFK